MRAFTLRRNADPSGISGTGIVAEGVLFTDETVVIRWLTEHRSTAIYANLDDLLTIHGHDGATEVLWYS